MILLIYLSMPLQPQQHCGVRALYTCVVDNDPVLLTGGSDRFIRLWNLNNSSQCTCIVKPDASTDNIHITYRYL